MCNNCTAAYWKHQELFSLALRLGVGAETPAEKEARENHDTAKENCETEAVEIIEYWNK